MTLSSSFLGLLLYTALVGTSMIYFIDQYKLPAPLLNSSLSVSLVVLFCVYLMTDELKRLCCLDEDLFWFNFPNSFEVCVWSAGLFSLSLYFWVELLSIFSNPVWLLLLFILEAFLAVGSFGCCLYLLFDEALFGPITTKTDVGRGSPSSYDINVLTKRKLKEKNSALKELIGGKNKLNEKNSEELTTVRKFKKDSKKILKYPCQ